jgi:CheY-like chemotaxis protein
MRFLLEDYGYKVLEAANGQEALDILQNMIPDLILMDLSMPVMDGLTAIRHIRKSNNNARTPIIAVTADGPSRYKEAIKAGCNDLIAKPLDFDSFKPAILVHLHT